MSSTYCIWLTIHFRCLRVNVINTLSYIDCHIYCHMCALIYIYINTVKHIQRYIYILWLYILTHKLVCIYCHVRTVTHTGIYRVMCTNRSWPIGLLYILSNIMHVLQYILSYIRLCIHTPFSFVIINVLLTMACIYCNI